MKLENIRIEEFNFTCPPLSKIETIFKQCNWWTLPEEEFQIMYKNTWKTFLVYDQKGNPVAHARIISDQKIYGAWVDFMVIPPARKRGIGELLANRMLETCKTQKLKMLKLMATKEGKKLYEKIGFKARFDYAPGMMIFLKYDK